MKIFALFLSLILAACATPRRDVTSLTYSDKLLEKADFVPHHDKGKMKSWLGMNLKVTPFSQLKIQVESLQGKKLDSRGEAHITVITPVEYDRVLASKIKMSEIEAIARKMKIQETSFTPVCVGRGTLMLEGRPQETYYVVVSAEGLFKIREAVAQLFVSRGGKAQNFNPELFYPHITLGYTQRDLFYEDGVIKDERSCIYQLHKEN